VEHFKRWATRPEVREWISKEWISPEERERRMRQIFGLEPKTVESKETGAPEPSPANLVESNQIKPNQTDILSR
jgi:hypothetical protein